MMIQAYFIVMMQAKYRNSDTRTREAVRKGGEEKNDKIDTHDGRVRKKRQKHRQKRQ